MSDLEITGGNQSTADSQNSYTYGGGIYNAGTLNVTNAIVTGNAVNASPVGVFRGDAFGGGNLFDGVVDGNELDGFVELGYADYGNSGSGFGGQCVWRRDLQSDRAAVGDMITEHVDRGLGTMLMGGPAGGHAREVGSHAVKGGATVLGEHDQREHDAGGRCGDRQLQRWAVGRRERGRTFRNGFPGNFE